MSDTPEKLDLESKDLIAHKLEQLEQLFPNLVTEGENGKVLDLDQLKNEFSTEVVEGTKERYRLEWPGKKEAIVTANLPTTKTLRPVKEDSVDFDNTENLYIEGDNLEVLKILQESYFGKIKMIYIDPPYNTGKDFVYKDNFSKGAQEELVESGQKDEYNQRLIENTDLSGRYHSNWLSMIYPRLKLARNLMSKEGVIFVSIDDNEIDNLKKMCDEVFGEKNFIGVFSVNSSPSGIDYGHMAKTNDYAIFYAKDITSAETNQLKDESKEFSYSDEIGGFNLYPLYNGNAAFNDKTRPNLVYPFYVRPEKNSEEDFYELSLSKTDGWQEVFPVVGKKDGIQRVWRWGKPKSSNQLNEDLVGHRTREGEFRVMQKSRLTTKVIRSLQLDNEVSSRRGTLEIETLFKKKVFSYPKPAAFIRRLAEVGTDKDSIMLDFFSGSSSSAHALMQLNAEDAGNRKYIMVQLPEACDEKSEAYKAGYKNICEIGKERIRRAGAKIKEETGAGIDYGFRVYRLDESNMADVYHTPQDYDQNNLELFADNVKEGRTADDLLAQIMLDWGLPLSLPIEETTIVGKRVFNVAGNSLMACFDTGIDEAFAKKVAEEEPLRIVFKDAGFSSDTAKSNVKQLLKQLSPETEMKVI